MNILISKDRTEIVLDGNIIETFWHNEPKNLQGSKLYRICEYFVQSNFNKEDINLTNELHTKCSILPKEDGQRFFLEMSKICYGLEEK
jgi:hypothetical protein